VLPGIGHLHTPSALPPRCSCRRTAASMLTPQSSNLSPQTSVLKPQSSNLSAQTSVLKPQCSNLSAQTSVLTCQCRLRIPAESPSCRNYVAGTRPRRRHDEGAT
jgi:hypothetical protein